jgi:ribosomal protein L30/L7E
LQGLRSKANALLENLSPLSRAGSSSDAAFISQILTSGTHQDKLSALVLIVRESPIHAVKELNRLRGMMGFKEDGTVGGGGNKDQRVAVIKALADWWTTGGGKDGSKLRYVNPWLSEERTLIVKILRRSAYAVSSRHHRPTPVGLRLRRLPQEVVLQLTADSRGAWIPNIKALSLTIRSYRTTPYHTFEYRVFMSSSSY